MIEPFADRYSFGFRKGKCVHMAVGEIATILDTKSVRKDQDNELDLSAVFLYQLSYDMETCIYGSPRCNWNLNKK